LGCILNLYLTGKGHAVVQLSHCATNRKVAGLIPDGVIEFFIDIEYQEYFLGVKVAGV
jgi:hypothetical protein